MTIASIEVFRALSESFAVLRIDVDTYVPNWTASTRRFTYFIG